ncbi:mitochondrial glyco protein [Armillaria gallica]|uniref:Mitochondrial glyco protein n=1 Tax=Armillaria gallica TaxID=47427 RepID=A0A2H3D6X8_ARMGA|nr:mitochondrial glyco protein [Armillaria gallica]
MSAIRSLRQLSLSSSRIVSARSVSCVSRARFTLPARQVLSSRAFSVSARAWGQGTTDVALSTKLEEELSYELEDVASKEVPEFLAKFKKAGIWTIEDRRSSEEVVLSRKFGNEEIRLTFAISDLRNSEEPYEEEDLDEEAEENEDSETIVSYPLHVALTISKGPSHGALALDMVCQDGQFVVDNAAFYEDASVGTSLTAEADWKRRGLYLGPQFDNLDIALQEEFERYLQERGIDESLAAFIPEYAEHKEQEEYTHWLTAVKKFVDV